MHLALDLSRKRFHRTIQSSQARYNAILWLAFGVQKLPLRLARIVGTCWPAAFLSSGNQKRGLSDPKQRAGFIQSLVTHVGESQPTVI
jgi:hypothetical protein